MNELERRIQLKQFSTCQKQLWQTLEKNGENIIKSLHETKCDSAPSCFSICSLVWDERGLEVEDKADL